MAGTISLSMTQQLDEFGAPLAGGRLYIIQAGTVSTPQNAFQDSALTQPWPNPIILDASGRLPQFFLADGSIKIRLTDRNGVEKLVADGLLVVGPSGGGGGSSIDPTVVMATGDIKVRYGTGVLSGFVRANARTIGSATSGATERANADTQALFEYLWNTDANLAVSTGRGASANADWTANKTLTLPDWRGRAISALDDMGNSAAGRLSSTYFGATATVLGAAGGSESHTLTTAQLAAHSHANTLTDPGHSHLTDRDNGLSPTVGVNANTTNALVNQNNGNTNSATTGITITNASAGSGNAHNNVQPTMLATLYLKL